MYTEFFFSKIPRSSPYLSPDGWCGGGPSALFLSSQGCVFLWVSCLKEWACGECEYSSHYHLRARYHPTDLGTRTFEALRMWYILPVLTKMNVWVIGSDMQTRVGYIIASGSYPSILSIAKVFKTLSGTNNFRSTVSSNIYNSVILCDGIYIYATLT